MHEALQALMAEEAELPHRTWDPEVFLLPRQPDPIQVSRVKEWISAGSLQSAEDHYLAARVLMRSDVLEDVWQAHLMASYAGMQGESRGRRLAAAAVDRWLMLQSYPQKYGTQYVSDGKKLRLYDVDSRTSDEERRAWDVAPLAAQQSRAEQLTVQHQWAIQNEAVAVVPGWLKQLRLRWERAARSRSWE